MKKCKTAIENKYACQKCCVFCDKTETCEDSCNADFKGEGCSCIIDEPEKNDLQTIMNAVPEALAQIKRITLLKKDLEDEEKKVRKMILESMEKNNIKKFESENISFTYVAATTRTSVDSAKLKDKYPEVYNECTKVSNVSASVKIAVK